VKGSEVRVFYFREEDTTRHGRGKLDDKKRVILYYDAFERPWSRLILDILVVNFSYIIRIFNLNNNILKIKY